MIKGRTRKIQAENVEMDTSGSSCQLIIRYGNFYDEDMCKKMNEPEVGKIYYFLTYANPEFKMPGLNPVVSVGNNIVGDEQEDKYYYQDTPSFTRLGLITESPNSLECWVQAISTNELGNSVVEQHQLPSIVNGAIERAEKLDFPKLKVCKGSWQKCT